MSTLLRLTETKVNPKMNKSLGIYSLEVPFKILEFPLVSEGFRDRLDLHRKAISYRFLTMFINLFI